MKPRVRYHKQRHWIICSSCGVNRPYIIESACLKNKKRKKHLEQSEQKKEKI